MVSIRGNVEILKGEKIFEKNPVIEVPEKQLT